MLRTDAEDSSSLAQAAAAIQAFGPLAATGYKLVEGTSSSMPDHCPPLKVKSLQEPY